MEKTPSRERNDDKSKKRRGAVVHDNSTGWPQHVPQGVPRCDVPPPNIDPLSVRPHGRTLVVRSATGQIVRRNNDELPKKGRKSGHGKLDETLKPGTDKGCCTLSTKLTTFQRFCPQIYY